MLIIALRTDRPQAEIFLLDNGKTVASAKWEAHRQLAETIHTKVDELLSNNGLSLDKVEAIIGYEGPGSFTGLRIGLSVVNALASGLSIPAVGAGGEKWLEVGVQKLAEHHDFQSVLPHYGSPVHITQPKK